MLPVFPIPNQLRFGGCYIAKFYLRTSQKIFLVCDRMRYRCTFKIDIKLKYFKIYNYKIQFLFVNYVVHRSNLFSVLYKN